MFVILYNITINIDPDIHDEWLRWMKQKHIPDVLATGLFTENKIYRIKSDEDEGYTYSIQYFCNSIKDYEKYLNEFAAKLQNEHTQKYKDKFAAFRTIMEEV